MNLSELGLRLGAWLVSSGFVLAVAYLLQRRLRGERPALNSLGFLGLNVFVISTLVLLAGLAGVLRAGALAGISLLGLAVLAAHSGTRAELAAAPDEVKAFKAHLSAWWRRLPRWLQWLSAAVLVCGTLRFAFLIWALPPFVWDSLTYHLTNVAHWVQSGRIEIFETPMVRIWTPANYELLAAWFAVFLHHDAFIEAAGLPGYAIALLAVYAAARGLGASPKASWMGALGYGFTPALLIAITGTKNDPHMAGYYLALLAFGLDWARRRSDARRNLVGQVVTAFVLLMLAVGTKAYIAHILPGLLLAVVITSWPDAGLGIWADHVRRAWRELQRSAVSQRAIIAVVLLAALFVGGYWNLRNWVLTGNPFYPYGVEVEGAAVAQGPHNDIFLDFGRAAENFSLLLARLGDYAAPVRPDLVDVTGWGWFVYALGIPLTLWALWKRPRARALFLGFNLSLALIFLSIRPSPWNLRYILWYPALFAFPFALWFDRLGSSQRWLRAGFASLFVATLGLNFSMTLNYNLVSPQQFAEALETPLWQRHSATLGLNTPENYEDVIAYVPPGQSVGYNVHLNGFIYPLFGADFSRPIEYVPFTTDTSCRLIAARMESSGVRYLFVAPEHSDDLKISRLRECANKGDYIQERGRELYVLAD